MHARTKTAQPPAHADDAYRHAQAVTQNLLAHVHERLFAPRKAGRDELPISWVDVSQLNDVNHRLSEIAQLLADPF